MYAKNIIHIFHSLSWTNIVWHTRIFKNGSTPTCFHNGKILWILCRSDKILVFVYNVIVVRSYWPTKGVCRTRHKVREFIWSLVRLNLNCNVFRLAKISFIYSSSTHSPHYLIVWSIHVWSPVIQDGVDRKLNCNFTAILLKHLRWEINEMAGRRACGSGKSLFEPLAKLNTNTSTDCVHEIWHRTESDFRYDWMHLILGYSQNL